jgi:hypothetical protein
LYQAFGMSFSSRMNLTWSPTLSSHATRFSAQV